MDSPAKKIVSPRVRIAPSPTGRLHVGTARAALFNWLFARKYGGTFILRIEDTDLERSDPAFEHDIADNLKWLGINWDEGVEVGGAYGPYRQSERGQIYAKYIRRLLDEDRAYHCFCSEEDLEAERQAMLARGTVPRYSGRCSALTRSEIAKRIEKGIRSIIRIRMPGRQVSIRDLIRGKVEFDTSLFGDIAIAKNITTPLYNFAVVIDDDEMKITHVLRGEDHLSNTPKQWILAELLGISHPEYGHFPLILGPDRSKLSKRHGAISIAEYREMGYLPEALVNFMVLLGWHPQDDQEIFTTDELIEKFSLERIQKGGAIFNKTKLDWLNSHYIRQRTDDELLDMLLPYWEKAGFLHAAGEGEWTRKSILRMVNLEKERIKTLADIVPATAYFFEETLSYDARLLLWKNSTASETTDVLAKIMAALGRLKEEEFTKDNIGKAITPLLGNDKGKIFWPFRVALSGRQASPGPLEIAEILGKKKTLNRLAHAQKLIGNVV